MDSRPIRSCDLLDQLPSMEGEKLGAGTPLQYLTAGPPPSSMLGVCESIFRCDLGVLGENDRRTLRSDTA